MITFLIDNKRQTNDAITYYLKHTRYVRAIHGPTKKFTTRSHLRTDGQIVIKNIYFLDIFLPVYIKTVIS